MARKLFERLAEKTMDGRPLTTEEAFSLTNNEPGRLTELFHWAGRIRDRFFGRAVSFCRIAPGRVGGCDQDCAWCAQSAVQESPAGLPVRPTDQAWLMNCAREAAQSGAACFCVVNSGRRPRDDDFETIEALNRDLAAEGLPPACASLGELNGRDAARMYAAGVVRYNHNLETSRDRFERVVRTHGYDDRIATLEAARAAGMALCCGGIFGIGESWGDRIELARTLRDRIQPAVVPLNFLDPRPGTRLAGVQALAPLECLHIVALYRFLLPEANIKIAGGRRMLRDLRSWIFHAGATSLLVGDYLTTNGRPVEDDLQMVHDLGLELTTDENNPQAA